MDTQPTPQPVTDLKVGDVARLNSGGPAMTITNLSDGDGPEGNFDCICWQEGHKKPVLVLNISPDCLSKV